MWPGGYHTARVAREVQLQSESSPYLDRSFAMKAPAQPQHAAVLPPQPRLT